MTLNALPRTNLLKFLLAGNAVFTIRSRATGTRFTYKIAKRNSDSTFHLVSVLTGPNNGSDYTYLGVVLTNRVFIHSSKSLIGQDAPSAKAFQWFWDHVASLPESCEVWHEGRCGKCGRLLTDPTSIETGLGPVCAGRAA